MILTVLDVETTGLDPDDEIIELAAVKMQVDIVGSRHSFANVSITQIDSTELLRQPSKSISPFIEKLTGLSDDMVKGKDFDYVLLKHFLCASDALIAHNASFDKRFLSALFPELNNILWFCTLKDIAWEKSGCYRKGLKHLLEKFSLPASRHRALPDVQSLISLLAVTSGSGQSFWGIAIEKIARDLMR